MFALHTGASGLRSQGQAMTVVGSNIANVNTVGYKSNRVNFQDLLATRIAGTDDTIGKGVDIASVQSDFSAGSLESTNHLTDVALEGDGFFVVNDDLGRSAYTRAGNFHFNENGILINPNGERVLGQTVDAQGRPQGFPAQIDIAGVRSDPQPTGDGSNGSGIRIAANLSAEAEPPAVPFDPTNVQADMFNYSTAVKVVDAQGAEHTAQIVFVKRPDTPATIDPATGFPIEGTGARNQWQYYVVFNAAEFGGNASQQVAVGGGFLRFNDGGRLLEATNGRFVQQAAAPGQPLTPPQLIGTPLANNAETPQVVLPFLDEPQVVGLFFGEGSNPNDPNDQRTGLDGITQFAGDSKTLDIQVDGHGAGALERIDVLANGVIEGRFDNGQLRPLYRLTVARFANNYGLEARGDNLFAETQDSGAPVFGNPDEGFFGGVRSRNLEKSNVDLSAQFVNMIETQRAFQANAKSITTSDEMLAEVVNLR